MCDLNGEEQRGRISAGWGCFSKLKHILCNKSIPWGRRLKLFEATVTATVLYGAGAWALTMSMADALERTRRRMLQKKCALPRLEAETWVEYVIRATHVAEDAASALGFSNSSIKFRMRKWGFAARSLQATDSRWSKRLINWRPWFRSTARRPAGRPFARWSDCFCKYAGGEWPAILTDKEATRIHLPGFLSQK